ncbi:hypothetical protein MNEG_4745 [Monoraphidium neglectum]|uniref:Uncharacterized protein n=1 Tax=Monoraphidium neglectum TaxID=145388 RepID=A0A0D2ND22_9CHLO|nr:hypothetical protein MNEG_4745 [Monoraphidium neglectum]KIZ03216.1 hypothetical protein MNEG_4745 [Monoraphidium neglectum]|eukprot:XP_013902235.1 hypothetical protein MNEG_4745 [Monoraphidium neglectum]
MHEVNAGQCFATGCNDRPISLLLASEEILHGMALLTAADSAAPKPPKAPNGTANPATLFQTTNTIAKFYCTFSASKKEPLSPVNRATVTASTNASAAAAAGNLPGLATHYQTIEKAFVARFLQYSLRSAYDASKTASKGLLKKSGACRSPCLRLAQQAAARTYFRAAEPIIARTNPDLVARANAILTAPDPLKTYKDLVLAYQAIATALGQDTKKMLLKCKTK